MNNQVNSVVRRSVPCYFCNNFLEEKYLYNHVKHCGSVLEECSFKCGIYVPRKNMEDHRKTCNKNITKGNNQIKEIQDSLWKDKIFSILTLLRSAINIEEKERRILQDNMSQCLKLLNSQQKSIDFLQFQLTNVIKECHQSNEILNQRLNDLEITCDNMEQRTSLNFQQISEQLKLLHDELINEQNKHDEVSDNWSLELKDLKTFLTKENIHINNIWQEQQQLINDFKLELEMRCKSSKELMDQQRFIMEKIKNLEKEIQGQLETTTNQKSDIKELKFQMKENLKYLEELIKDNLKFNISEFPDYQYKRECCDQYSNNGRLLWKIDRYKEKMTEAKENHCILYSPKFLSKEYGYTLRVKLFLNGIGQWKDQHIIGCLQVETGKWDPLLDWPCILKATAILRNQENPANDVKKFVKAVGQDKSNSNDVNKETGIYMFIPHTILTRYPGYIKDNALFLDIQVTSTKSSASTLSLTS